MTRRGLRRGDASVTFTTDRPDNGDRFGYVVATGDFRGDGDADVAVSLPFENSGTSTDNYADAGAVGIVSGAFWRWLEYQ